MTTIDPSYENEILYKENKKLKDKIFNQNKSIKELNITIKGYRIDQEERINQEIKQAERIKELESKLSGFSDLTGLMQSSLEGDTQRISELLDQNTEQDAEIARLKEVIAKCKAGLELEEDYQRRNDGSVVSWVVEALAAIKEEGL